MPRVLIVHYSCSGHTARLAQAIAERLRERDCEVDSETIRTLREWGKWLLLPLLPLLPFLPLYLASAGFRRLWHRVYFQPEQAIRPLAHPDVSGCDPVLLGTPKWLYLSYPVVCWLGTLQGLAGKRVGCFATFCGPPLEVFDLDMLFVPLAEHLRSRGAVTDAQLDLSSDFHPYFSGSSHLSGERVLDFEEEVG